MNPNDEERLRNEVIFLHSLWHQGPPQNPIIIHPPFPSPSQPYIPQHTWHLRRHQHPAPARTRSLPPIPSTTFKRKKNKKKKRNRDNAARPDPGPEWPIPVQPDPGPTTGWPAPKPGPSPLPEVSPQEKEKLAAMQAQHKACKALKEFLSSYDDDDGDDDGDDGEDDEGGDGWEEFEEFFVGIFLEDHELRGYYQRCFEIGEFCCLVCGAIGKKNSGKRFKHCGGLVQHSMSVLKTVKKRAHRGFGRAVCKVLGWDVDRLPTIVMKGKPLGLEMKHAQVEGEPKENNVANDDDRKDGFHKSDDRVVSLEHGDVAVEEPAQGVVQSINKGEDEPKEKVEDDGKDGAGKSGDEVVSLGLGDEPVEEHVQRVDQSISEGEPKKPADCHIDNSNVLQQNQAK